MTTSKYGFTPQFWFFVAILVAMAIMSAGCVHTTVELPNNGGKFSRTSFLSNQAVGNVTVHTSGPDAGVKIDNYGNNSTEVAEAAIALAVAVAKK